MIDYNLIPVNNSKFEDQIFQMMADELNLIWDQIEPVIERNTPTKTKKLIGNNKRTDATKSSLVCTFVNDTPYWIYVEGLDWDWKKVVSTTKNFHKWPPTNNSTIFYTWEWAAFMSRSFDEIIAKYK